jgi:hypothetical protein
VLAQLLRWMSADGRDDRLPRAVAKSKFKGSRSPTWAVPPGAGAAYLTFWKIELFIFIFIFS